MVSPFDPTVLDASQREDAPMAKQDPVRKWVMLGYLIFAIAIVALLVWKMG